MARKKRVTFGKNTRVEKVYMKDLEAFPGKTVGMVLQRDACLQLAENLIRAARASGSEIDRVDVTLFLRAASVLTITATSKIT